MVRSCDRSQCRNKPDEEGADGHESDDDDIEEGDQHQDDGLADEDDQWNDDIEENERHWDELWEDGGRHSNLLNIEITGLLDDYQIPGIDRDFLKEAIKQLMLQKPETALDDIMSEIRRSLSGMARRG